MFGEISPKLQGEYQLAQRGAAGQALCLSTTQPFGLAYANKLTDPGSNGLLSRTALNTVSGVTLTAGSGNLVVTNGNGVSGNPTIDVGTNVALLNAANAFSKQQYFSATSLTDGASISWDVSANQVASVTLGGNRTLANPTNLQNGGTYILIVKQDGTGSRTLAYGSVYKWPGGTAPTLTTTASAVDILSFVSDGTNMYGVSQLNFH